VSPVGGLTVVMTGGGMAAAPELPDFNALARERVQIQHRLRNLQLRYGRLQELVGAFPNEVTVLQERRVADELEAVTKRIDEIDATLIPLRLSQ
jgi:hypothetical protein